MIKKKTNKIEKWKKWLPPSVAPPLEVIDIKGDIMTINWFEIENSKSYINPKKSNNCDVLSFSKFNVIMFCC